ncbi:hypothetical protein D3C87_1325750 [compost metagenome]
MGDLLEETARGLDACCHVDQLVPNDLSLNQRLAKRVAQARPLDCVVQADLREGGRTGGKANALLVEVGHHGRKALMLRTNEIAHGNAAPVELEMGSVRGPPAHLLERRTGQPWRVSFDEQQ